MTGDVLILTGPPGAGKTTVAAALATGAQRPAVHLETDLFYRAIRSGFILPFLPAAERQNQVVLTAIVRSVDAYAKGGFEVIVDGILGPWFLPHFQELRGLRLDYVVLLPDLEVTLGRARTRVGGHLRDPEPITGLHAAFTKPGDLAGHTLDTTGEEPTATASRVRREIATGRYRLPPD